MAKKKAEQKKLAFDLSSVEFAPTFGKIADNYHASLQPTANQLCFSDGLIKRLGVENWGDILMGYDKNNHIIVLKKADPTEYGARPFVAPDKKSKGSEARRITIKSFLRFFSIDGQVPRRWDVERYGDNILALSPSVPESGVEAQAE